MGRFGRPFRKTSDLLLGFCRLCAKIYAPRGSFVNFLAQMTITVLRYRREKSGATTQPKELLQSYLDRDAVVQS